MCTCVHPVTFYSMRTFIGLLVAMVAEQTGLKRHLSLPTCEQVHTQRHRQAHSGDFALVVLMCAQLCVFTVPRPVCLSGERAGKLDERIEGVILEGCD